METKAVLMISMPVDELIKLINTSVSRAVKEEFAPLRRQFEERLIPLKETAEKLGVSERTMYNLKVRGELVPIYVSGKPTYRESDITQYLNRGNNGTTTLNNMAV